MQFNTKFRDSSGRKYNIGDDASKLSAKDLEFVKANNLVDTGKGKEAGGDAGSDDSGAGSGASKLNAKELIEKINEAESAEAINALIPEGEARATVLKAAESRIATF